MQPIRSLVAALAFAGIAASSQAAAVRVTFDSDIFNGMGGYDAVRIQFPLQGGGTSTVHSVAAGRFQGSATNLVSVDPGVFVDSVDDLFMYCYDIYQPIAGNDRVDYTIDFQGATAQTLRFLGAVNSVKRGSGAYDPFAWLRPANKFEAAAIQIGIWESLYEADLATNWNLAAGWDLTSGSFQAWRLEALTTASWNAFRAAIPGSASLDPMYTMVLRSDQKQDMIAGDPPLASVPEPGSLALLGLALTALAWGRRKSR